MSAYQGLVTLPLSIPDNPSQLQSLPSGPGDAETAACSSADRGAVQVPVPHSGSAILPHSPGHQPPLPEPQGGTEPPISPFLPAINTYTLLGNSNRLTVKGTFASSELLPQAVP